MLSSDFLNKLCRPTEWRRQISKYLCLAEHFRLWELLDRKERDMKDDRDEIPMPHLLYIVLGLVAEHLLYIILGLVAAIAGAAIVIVRILQHP